MKDKVVRFAKALSNESIKRLPYIVLVFGLILLYQGYTNGRTTRENSTDTKALLTKVAELSEDNANLSRDNHKLQQQGIDLQKKTNDQLACITNLFIDFINSGRALTKADAAKCSVSVENIAQSQSPASQRGTTNLGSGASSVPSSQSTPGTPPAQSNSSQPNNTSGGNFISNAFDKVIYKPVTNFLKTALGVE